MGNEITAIMIAEYFLTKESMTQKKLQKLVYYAYVWYIVRFNNNVNRIKNLLFIMIIHFFLIILRTTLCNCIKIDWDLYINAIYIKLYSKETQTSYYKIVDIESDYTRMTDLEYHFTEQVTKRGISINYNGKDCFVFIDNLTFPGITDFYVEDLNFIYHNGGKEMI